MAQRNSRRRRIDPRREARLWISHQTTPYGNGDFKVVPVPLAPPLYMSPNLPVYYAKNIPNRQPSSPRDGAERLAPGTCRANRNNFFGRQFGVRVRLAARIGWINSAFSARMVIASLCYRVGVVYCLCPQVQVRRVHASRIISGRAIVKNKKTMRYRAVVDLPRVPVCPVLNHLSVPRVSESAVAFIASRCGPQPAGSRLPNLAPKPLFGSHQRERIITTEIAQEKTPNHGNGAFIAHPLWFSVSHNEGRELLYQNSQMGNMGKFLELVLALK